METSSNFTNTLLPALEAKTQWYDTEELPRLLESYRLLHTCVKNLFDLLVKKALIVSDPYKFDKKFSKIEAPESGQFIETEKAVIMGQRFSDYEGTLDFLCNYYKFSVSNITLGNLKKLVDLSNSFLWNSFTVNSNKSNTRVLAIIVSDLRKKSDPMTVSMLNDALTKASKAMSTINSILKDYADFQREFYKGQIRRLVFSTPGFDASKAFESTTAEYQMIRKNFNAAMGKSPFYKELVDELILEDQGENKEELQKKVLAKMNIVSKQTGREEKQIDTKAMLMDSAHILGGLPQTLGTIVEKIKANHDILESEHETFFVKLKRTFMKAFNIQEAPLQYTVIIVEPSTGAKRQEKINYEMFVTEIEVKARRYSIFNQKKSAGYNKISTMEEDKLFEFISAQISDCNRMLVMLNALDEFFKVAANPVNKSRIKGLKIDLTSFKNTVIKANSLRVEYATYIEEAEQMKKLGIG